jgi:hypothetical protein
MRRIEMAKVQILGTVCSKCGYLIENARTTGKEERFESAAHGALRHWDWRSRPSRCPAAGLRQAIVLGLLQVRRERRNMAKPNHGRNILSVGI